MCSFGDYVGGDLWVEQKGADEPGLVPPPGAVTAQQKKLRGRLIDTRHSWVHFDAHLQHAVTPVTFGRRVSVALYVLKGWETLGQDLLEDLGELGFPLPDQTATSLNPAAATVELKPAEVQALPGDDYKVALFGLPCGSPFLRAIFTVSKGFSGKCPVLGFI